MSDRVPERATPARPARRASATPHGGMPLRQQVRVRVGDLLARRRLRPGDKIPTEPELIELLGVSRATLREGLQLLEQEGVIASRHGVGRFLVAPPDSLALDISRLRGVSELLQEHHIRASQRVLDVSHRPSTASYADALEIVRGSPVVQLERVWVQRAGPVIYSVDIFPESLLGAGWSRREFNGSLLDLLESRSGRVLGHAQSAVSAVTLPSDLARRIGVSSRDAWLRMEQLNFDTHGKPMIFSRDYHRGDWITFHTVRLRR